MITTEIHAVVRVVYPTYLEKLWFDVPAEPWPEYLRLWKHTSPDEVSIILAMLAEYKTSYLKDFFDNYDSDENTELPLVAKVKDCQFFQR